MWQLAKNFNMYNIIKNQIRDKKELRSTKKKRIQN